MLCPLLTYLALLTPGLSGSAEPPVAEVREMARELPSSLEDQPSETEWGTEWTLEQPFEPGTHQPSEWLGSLGLSIERGLSLRSSHIDSLRRPERFDEEPLPLLDEEGFGLELWYALPIVDRADGQTWQLGLGLRGLFAEADPGALEGCLISLSVRF